LSHEGYSGQTYSQAFVFSIALFGRLTLTGEGQALADPHVPRHIWSHWSADRYAAGGLGRRVEQALERGAARH